MEARLREEFPDVDVELIPSGGGAFEVRVDDRLIYSKKQTRRHAEWEEIRDLVKAS